MTQTIAYYNVSMLRIVLAPNRPLIGRSDYAIFTSTNLSKEVSNV